MEVLCLEFSLTCGSRICASCWFLPIGLGVLALTMDKSASICQANYMYGDNLR